MHFWTLYGPGRSLLMGPLRSFQTRLWWIGQLTSALTQGTCKIRPGCDMNQGIRFTNAPANELPINQANWDSKYKHQLGAHRSTLKQLGKVHVNVISVASKLSNGS